jgi:hypothetical protein
LDFDSILKAPKHVFLGDEVLKAVRYDSPVLMDVVGL